MKGKRKRVRGKRKREKEEKRKRGEKGEREIGWRKEEGKGRI